MRYTLITLIAVLLSACKYLGFDVQQGFEQSAGWNTPAVYTTADVRMITQRPNPNPMMGNTITCTEPSPDVAKALATAAALAAQGGNGAVGGGFGASGASAEAVAELAGRSTALLGLRDGLYRACEAYANGVIGDDVYSLVVSRYGQLMTTLFLGQDITGAAGVASQGATTSIGLQPLANPLGGGQTNNITNVPNKSSANIPKGSEPKTAPVASEPVSPGTAEGPDARPVSSAEQQPAAKRQARSAYAPVCARRIFGARPDY